MSCHSKASGVLAVALASLTLGAAAQTPDAAVRSLAATCFTCHGTDGRSVGGVPPSLAGRDKAELIRQMQDFRSGKRPSTIMQQHAKGYTDAQIDQIAGYFSSQPAAAPRASAGN